MTWVRCVSITRAVYIPLAPSRPLPPHGFVCFCPPPRQSLISTSHSLVDLYCFAVCCCEHITWPEPLACHHVLTGCNDEVNLNCVCEGFGGVCG